MGKVLWRNKYFKEIIAFPLSFFFCKKKTCKCVFWFNELFLSDKLLNQYSKGLWYSTVTCCNLRMGGIMLIYSIVHKNWWALFGSLSLPSELVVSPCRTFGVHTSASSWYHSWAHWGPRLCIIMWAFYFTCLELFSVKIDAIICTVLCFEMHDDQE
jgi:hypothetical protein